MLECDVFELPGGRKLAGLAVPEPPAAEAGYAVARYSVERGNRYCVEYGADLGKTFCAFLGRGPAHHEFYAEAMPVGVEPDADTAPVRRCEWTEHGWGKWHRG